MHAAQAPLNIIIVDDEAGFVESLQRDANPHCILLTHVTNVEDGTRILKENSEKAFSGIILDRNCYFDNKMKDRGNILGLATNLFRDLAKNLPIVILTSEKEKAGDEQGRLYKVFSKEESDIKSMFDYLKKESQNLIQIKYRNQFPDVFSVIDKCFKSYPGNDIREDLIHALMRLASNNNLEIKSGLVCLRRIIENIHFSINDLDEVVLPTHVLKRGTFNDVMKHLVVAKKLAQHDITFNAFWNVHTISSDFAAHPNPEKAFPYVYRVVLYQTMGILMWYKDMFESELTKA